MVTVRRGLLAGSAALGLLLAVLTLAVGLGAVGWAVAVACALGVIAWVTRTADGTLGPADLVTLTRAVLTCALAALVAETFLHDATLVAMVALAVVALLSDLVDGWVARRTRTVSPFGTRFDGEVDAFLILVLSVYVAAADHGWVLAIGLARYAFGAAGWILPWMRAQLLPRYWRKVVTAVQGIVLTVAVAEIVQPRLMSAALAVALALLAESFGRDVLWLWRRRPPVRRRVILPAGGSGELRL